MHSAAATLLQRPLQHAALSEVVDGDLQKEGCKSCRQCSLVKYTLQGLYALKTMSTIRAAAAPLARIAQAAFSGASACANNLASRVRSMAEHKMSEMPDKVIVLSTPPLSPHHHCGSSWQDLVSPSDSPSLHSSEDTMDREADLQRRLHAALQRAEHAEQRSQQLATEVQGLQSQVTAAVDRAQKAELRADGLQTQLHDAGQGRKAAEAEVSRLQAQVDSVMQRALTAEGRADRLQFDQLCPLTSVPTKIDLPVVVGFRESQPASCDALSKVIASSEICSESSPTSVLPPTTEAFGPAGHAAPQQDAPQARTSQDSVEPDKVRNAAGSFASTWLHQFSMPLCTSVQHTVVYRLCPAYVRADSS